MRTKCSLFSVIKKIKYCMLHSQFKVLRHKNSDVILSDNFGNEVLQLNLRKHAAPYLQFHERSKVFYLIHMQSCLTNQKQRSSFLYITLTTMKMESWYQWIQQLIYHFITLVQWYPEVLSGSAKTKQCVKTMKYKN